MKILLIAYEYPPNVTSGLGNYSGNLVDYLINNGHNVTLITEHTDEIPRNIHHKNLSIIFLQLPRSNLGNKIFPNFLDKRLFFNRELKRLFSKINLDDFDLLHIMDENQSYFLAGMQKPRIPIIISLNAYYAISTSWNPFEYYDFNPDFMIKYPYYNYIKMKLRKSLPYADLLIANSYFTARVVMEESGIASNKFEVVYRGIDTGFFDQEADEKKYSSQKILFVGRNMERKGLIYLIKAMGKVCWIFPDAKLTVIGVCSALYKRKVMRWIRKLELEKNVEFIDYKDNNELLPYYKEANIFVMPSLIEGLGQVLMEAMMSRTPVIGSSAGGIPEVIAWQNGSLEGIPIMIDDSNCGLLVEPKDDESLAQAIITLLRNPERCKDMGEAGRRKVMMLFDARCMSKNTLRLYEKMVILRCR